MSVTVYVDGWDEQPSQEQKVYVAERYPYMSDEDFAFFGYQRDEDGRYFEIERVYDDPFPEMNLSNGNWRDLAVALGIDNGESVGAVAFVDLPDLIRQCLLLTNSQKKCIQAARPGSRKGNLIDFGTTEYFVREKAQRLLSIITFAQSKKKGVYWG